MKVKITLTAQPGIESKAEIEHEIRIIQDIIGEDLSSGEGRTAIFEGEFYEFYERIKDRIMRKIKAYE